MKIIDFGTNVNYKVFKFVCDEGESFLYRLHIMPLVLSMNYAL